MDSEAAQPPSSSAPPQPTAAPPLLEPDSSPSSTVPAPQGGGAPDDAGVITTDQLVVDPSVRLQAMTGLGVNANVHSWKGGQLKSAIDQYTALGAVTWRVIIEKADWEPAQVGQANAIDDAYDRRIYETPKMQDLWNTISYIESSPHQTVSLSIMGGVPDWMGGTGILADKEDYWVRMIASLLDYGRRKKGLELTLLSPLNEPDLNGIEGPKVDPAQMTELLDKLARRLDAMGMSDVRFVVPDTSSAQGARDQYLPALLANPTVAARIARVGIHSYSGDAASVPPAVAQGPAAGAGVWVTEFNTACDACDQGVEPSDTWDRSFGMGRDLLGLIGQGANGAQLYDAWDGYYEHHGAFGYWGALRYDSATGRYTPRQAFSILALFLGAVPPMSLHVGSTGGQAVQSQAFLSPDSKRITVLGTNSTSSVQRFRILVAGASALTRAELRTVTARGGLSLGKSPSAQGNSLIVTVPAQTVFAVSVSLQ
ncbi:MAG: hypothetical protein HOQ07_12420 [Sinomonas sp.]|nr:hypothetical protein [Sinomonas sp.]